MAIYGSCSSTGCLCPHLNPRHPLKFKTRSSTILCCLSHLRGSLQALSVPRVTEHSQGCQFFSRPIQGCTGTGHNRCRPPFETSLTLPHICGTMLLRPSLSPVFNYSSFVPCSASTPFIPKRGAVCTPHLLPWHKYGPLSASHWSISTHWPSAGRICSRSDLDASPLLCTSEHISPFCPACNRCGSKPMPHEPNAAGWPDTLSSLDCKA